jgi:hypothetical protein
MKKSKFLFLSVISLVTFFSCRSDEKRISQMTDKLFEIILTESKRLDLADMITKEYTLTSNAPHYCFLNTFGDTALLCSITIDNYDVAFFKDLTKKDSPIEFLQISNNKTKEVFIDKGTNGLYNLQQSLRTVLLSDSIPKQEIYHEDNYYPPGTTVGNESKDLDLNKLTRSEKVMIAKKYLAIINEIESLIITKSE